MYHNESRSEDGVITYTWNHFLFHDQEHSQAEWALRLPMTKSVSKAMDAVEEFVAKVDISLTATNYRPPNYRRHKYQPHTNCAQQHDQP